MDMVRHEADRMADETEIINGKSHRPFDNSAHIAVQERSPVVRRSDQVIVQAPVRH